ncbi:hypothetical protein A1O7_01683 [Cladophialophora yegresii CBS 114405]|uniref:G-patch domain-containing protein n=1 Tax=Cladophialophora yegresii CBS 114405 TaxID=1182544 RepID=W9WB91_9EURO|nr:uncharacterized protein A1O7_01683 [Cladophialophora yegresii CBS 114405]EXJ65342.1 hypothetical protein A1O7_01683 [Cladophialophora yegresii CBS 114405]
MTQQGWSEGQALGARNASTTSSSSRSGPRSGLATDTERLAAARVGVLFKDDNLGLGATRNSSHNVEAQRTGFDAFQGLLGRLNGKAEAVQKEEGKKREEKRLEMFFRGRWGGMVFVNGGVLVGSQDQDQNQSENEPENKGTEELEKRGQDAAQDAQGVDGEVSTPSQDRDHDREERRRLKAAKKQRKEDKRRRKEEKAQRKAARREAKGRDNAALSVHKSPISPDEPVSSAASEDEVAITSKVHKKKRKLKPEQQVNMTGNGVVVESETLTSGQSSPRVPVLALKNGRHLLRGRNIQAKKMILADTKGLDQIFMR